MKLLVRNIRRTGRCQLIDHMSWSVEKLRRDGLLLLTGCCVLVIGMGVSLRRAHISASLNSPLIDPLNDIRPTAWQRRSLQPVPNPDPTAPTQPARCRPFHVATTHDGQKAYVTLSGKEIQPGTEVVVVDVPGR